MGLETIRHSKFLFCMCSLTRFRYPQVKTTALGGQRAALRLLWRLVILLAYALFALPGWCFIVLRLSDEICALPLQAYC